MPHLAFVISDLDQLGIYLDHMFLRLFFEHRGLFTPDWFQNIGREDSLVVQALGYGESFLAGAKLLL